MAGTRRVGAREHPRKLLNLEGDYSLSTIRRLGLDQVLTSRDLDGFFEHVWTVHPMVGASADEPLETAVGPPSSEDVAPRHTIVEGRVAYSPRLRRIPVLNFLIGQAVLLVRLDRLIRRESISLIRANDPFYLGILGVLLARRRRIPLVVRLIANYDGNFYASGSPAYPRLFRRRAIEKWLGRNVLRRADLVAAGNYDILNYALANGADAERSTVFLVGNLIDSFHFEEAPEDRPSVRGELGLDDRPLAICVGRLEPDKHPEDVVRAVAQARLRERGVVALLVGDGTMRPQLEAMARELGVEDDVVFAGNRDQRWIAAAYSSADIVLSPVTGRALVEAQLSGTPVVAYDVDWQSELVHDGETGLLTPYRDVEAMADAVDRLLADRQWARSLGAVGREYTAKVMDPDALTAHERQQYEKVLASARR